VVLTGGLKLSQDKMMQVTAIKLIFINVHSYLLATNFHGSTVGLGCIAKVLDISYRKNRDITIFFAVYTKTCGLTVLLGWFDLFHQFDFASTFSVV